MGSDYSDKIDEIASDLDEIKTTADELTESAPSSDAGALGKLQDAVEEARDAADELEDQQGQRERPMTNEHDDDLAPSVGERETEGFPQTAEEFEDRTADEELDDEDIVGK